MPTAKPCEQRPTASVRHTRDWRIHCHRSGQGRNVDFVNATDFSASTHADTAVSRCRTPFYGLSSDRNPFTEVL